MTIQGSETLLPDGLYDVFVAADGVARRTSVKVGRSGQGVIEVRSGLTDGDRVVVFGANRLKDGIKIRFHRIDGELTGDSGATGAGEDPQ